MINNFDLPEIGDKLIVKVEDSEDRLEFTSQLLEIIDDKKFIISGPVTKNIITPLNLGLSIIVKYNKENKARYSFNAKIEKRINEGVYKLYIVKTGSVKKMQQRNYFRLPIMLDINKVNKHDTLSMEEALVEDCITEDISGGGLKILCNTEHKIEDIVICSLSIEGINIKFTGEVVRIDSNLENLEYKYAIGIRFIDIIENNREKIIKYIFDKQRSYRKKGLI